jgi:glutathione S-transferase
MKATLYGNRLSPFVEKVARALQVKEIEFKLVGLRSPGDLRKWNPTTGKMPVLDIGGERLHDSTFICRKLEELAPQPPLYAADLQDRARQRLLEDWSDESLYYYSMGCRWAPQNERDTVDQLVADFPAPLRPIGRIILPRVVGGQARAQGLARLSLAELTRELGGLLDALEVQLGDKAFFFSDTVGIADLAVYGQLNTMRSGPTPQCEELISDRPWLRDYFKRVDEASRPQTRGTTARGLKAA